jgi:ABC-type glycerol-3-phosphate transport system substrate-binding protein
MLLPLALYGKGKQEEKPVAPAAAAEATTKAPADYTGKLVVWSFTDEVGNMVAYFKKVYPNVEIEFVNIPNQDEVYLNKVNQTMRAGSDIPDVFTGEVAYVKQFINAGYWANLSAAPFNAGSLTGDLVKYAVDLGRDGDGNLRAMTWQACPGGLFYRRSIAKEVLGTDDPAEVSKWTNSLEKFYELGAKVRDKYAGAKTLVAGYTEMFEFVGNLRDTPWIVDDKLVIDEDLIEYMRTAKKMRTEGIEGGVSTWSPPWFSSMADASVMCYILPTWGLHYVLKPNAEPEANKGEAEWQGDWGLADPPASYHWGGTWAGINARSANKELAWEFIKFITTNEDFLATWAKTTGDFLGNKKVVEKIMNDFSEPFLGGQNHYIYFNKEAAHVDVSRIGPWDFQINNAFSDQVELYANGEKTEEQAIADFKAAVKEILPDVDVN